jgi:hypothetical protein
MLKQVQGPVDHLYLSNLQVFDLTYAWFSELIVALELILQCVLSHSASLLSDDDPDREWLGRGGGAIAWYHLFENAPSSNSPIVRTHCFQD